MQFCFEILFMFCQMKAVLVYPGMFYFCRNEYKPFSLDIVSNVLVHRYHESMDSNSHCGLLSPHTASWVLMFLLNYTLVLNNKLATHQRVHISLADGEWCGFFFFLSLQFLCKLAQQCSQGQVLCIQYKTVYSEAQYFVMCSFFFLSLLPFYH